jgi:pimeloyl-ACP methyl ester carboxylesterase
VQLAAPARPLGDMILAQSRYLAALDGETSAEEAAKLAELDAVIQKIRALGEQDAARTDVLIGAPPAYWLDLARHDAIAEARGIAAPTLLLQGEADYQVTLVEDFAVWRDALSGEPWFTAQSFAGLNHLFMPAGSPPSPNDYLKAARFDPQVIAVIADWMKRHP